MNCIQFDKKFNIMKNNYVILCESDQQLSRDQLEMADEFEKLLPNGERDESETESLVEDTMKDITLSNIVAMLKEQNRSIESLRKCLKEEQVKNNYYEQQIKELKQQVSDLQGKCQNNDQLELLKNSIDAKEELQAANLDELRYHIQKLRKHIDITTKNGEVETHNPLPKSVRVRKNSTDSNGSTSSAPSLLGHFQPSHHAEYTWRINGFTKKLKKIQSGSYEDPSRSEAFTTGLNGYRLSLWAYLNGRGKGSGKCLSIYVRVMAGEFDPILYWPIKPCYTFYLLSQHSDVSKRLDLVKIRDLSIKHVGISRPLKDDKSVIVGFDDFIIHEDVEQKNYLLDDSIFIKCVVEIPPL